jgi:tetratricopeptide (TPR) repeat protein/aminoglycoside phosphotransferase (APT) family kinase protein
MLNRRIGHYRLTARIGEGGMGVVYLAEREDEFRQRVAIKLVRYAAESPEVAARLRVERQTLAAISHPNIVALLDGGTTEEGLPYLVMEYIEGQPIDEYCAAHSLDLAGRLRLFLLVCAAVEYAHRHLIVHCDLKPTNILVTADGTPKLLDFGIAKVLAPQSEAGAFMTVGAQRPFTPRYASPEQFMGKPVTTASDVYALGMILYQLLTGQSPYRFQTHSDAEMISAACVQEPRRPSTALETAPEARHLEGDLDAIVLKALRKEPQNRYGSVEQLAEDIRRHREGRPVLAHRGTFRYRATKFVLRNRIAVAATALVALAILGGVSGAVWQARVAMAARARAERRFQDVRKLATFMLFDLRDAVQKLPGSTPVQEMLAGQSLQYLDSLAHEASGDSSLELELVEAYNRLGDVQGNPYQANLGDTVGALASYHKALAIAEPLARLEPGNRRAARALALVHLNLSDVLLLSNQNREAVGHARQATAAFEKLAAAEPSSVQAHIDLAACLEGLGDQLHRGLGDEVGGLAAYRKSLAEWETVASLNPAHVRARRAVAGLNMKISDFDASSDLPAAMARLEKGLAALGALSAADQASVPARRLEGNIRRRMGDIRWELKDSKGALEYYRQALEISTALAEHDPTNMQAQFDLAVVLGDRAEMLESDADFPAALRDYSQAADTLDRLVKTDPGNIAWHAHLGEMLVRIGAMLIHAGQRGDASHQTARGLELLRQIADDPAAPVGELIRAARSLVLCQPPELRAPGASLRYSRRAVDLTKGQNAYALDTEAEAEFQSGDRQAALELVHQALALTGASQPQPWLRRALEEKLDRLK